MSPRYVLDARTAITHFPGIGRYVINLARALVPLLSPEERLTFLRDPTQPSSWDLSALAGERVRAVDVPFSPFSSPAVSRPPAPGPSPGRPLPQPLLPDALPARRADHPHRL